MLGNLGFRIAFIVLGPLVAQTAAAQWQPQWSTPWQHPEPAVGALPMLVSVAIDGSTYAAAGTTHHSLSHLAIMRFNADGTFAWLQEHEAYALAGIALMGANRVAIAGDGGAIATPVNVRVYDRKTGALIWARQAGGGRVQTDERSYTPQLAVDASGNLMVLASDQGDYVVIRFDSDGNPLPTWRTQVDAQNNVAATAIVALPDGGAVITGSVGDLGGGSLGGNVTVRLDANGTPVFTDIQMSPVLFGVFTFGVAHLGLDNDGNIIVAAARENGVTTAQVWKISSTGTRLWTTYLPDPPVRVGTLINGFALSANGNPLIALGTGGGGGLHLVRLDGATGVVLSDTKAPIDGNSQTVAVANNGRILLGGYGSHFNGLGFGLMAEFTENGQPCRVAENTGFLSSIKATADANGWRVVGATEFVQGVSTAATISQFDSDGECTLGDSVFANGFESELP